MIPLPSALLSTGRGVIWPCPTAPTAFASNCGIRAGDDFAGGDGDGRRAIAGDHSPFAEMDIAGDVDVAGDRVDAAEHQVSEEALWGSPPARDLERILEDRVGIRARSIALYRSGAPGRQRAGGGDRDHPRPVDLRPALPRRTCRWQARPEWRGRAGSRASRPGHWRARRGRRRGRPRLPRSRRPGCPRRRSAPDRLRSCSSRRARRRAWS